MDKNVFNDGSVIVLIQCNAAVDVDGQDLFEIEQMVVCEAQCHGLPRENDIELDFVLWQVSQCSSNGYPWIHSHIVT